MGQGHRKHPPSSPPEGECSIWFLPRTEVLALECMGPPDQSLSRLVSRCPLHQIPGRLVFSVDAWTYPLPIKSQSPGLESQGQDVKVPRWFYDPPESEDFTAVGASGGWRPWEFKCACGGRALFEKLLEILQGVLIPHSPRHFTPGPEGRAGGYKAPRPESGHQFAEWLCQALTFSVALSPKVTRWWNWLGEVWRRQL